MHRSPEPQAKLDPDRSFRPHVHSNIQVGVVTFRHVQPIAAAKKKSVESQLQTVRRTWSSHCLAKEVERLGFRSRRGHGSFELMAERLRNGRLPDFLRRRIQRNVDDGAGTGGEG